MDPFVHTQHPARIVFGAGQLAALPGELDRLEVTRVMAIAGAPESVLLNRVCELTGSRLATRWDQVRQHVPGELADLAAKHATDHDVDALVTVGGGSTTGLAKAIARRHRVPIVAVPTTYAGSEMTPIWGETQDARKTTGRDLGVLPATVIYDPELTVSLPPAISGASGMNAMAHCVEAVYAPGESPITTGFALQAIESLAAGLPGVVSDPADLDARGRAQFGAYLAGMVMATAGISIHHHLCHVLGGMYDLPHAELHTVLLPHAVAAVADLVPDLVAPVTRALGGDRASTSLFDLATSMNLPTSLAAIGMTLDQVDAAVPRCVDATARDIVPLDPAAARSLLERAVEGTRP